MYKNFRIVKTNSIRDFTLAKKFMIKKHYLKSLARGCKENFVLLVDNQIYGIAQFGCPISKLEDQDTIELKRFVLNELAIKNTASWFLSLCLKEIKNYSKVITFADTKEGHKGIIYKAANFKFVGEQNKKGQVIKEGKKLHHLRKCYQKRNGTYTEFAKYIQAKLKLGKAKTIQVPKKLKFEYELRG